MNRAQAVHGRGDLAGAGGLAPPLEQVGDLPGGEVLGHDLALLTLPDDRIGDVVTALAQHPLHEVGELGKRLDRRFPDERLQGRPLTLPGVTIPSRLLHTLRMHDLRPRQTPNWR